MGRFTVLGRTVHPHDAQDQGCDDRDQPAGVRILTPSMDEPFTDTVPTHRSYDWSPEARRVL